MVSHAVQGPAQVWVKPFQRCLDALVEHVVVVEDAVGERPAGCVFRGFDSRLVHPHIKKKLLQVEERVSVNMLEGLVNEELTLKSRGADRCTQLSWCLHCQQGASPMRQLGPSWIRHTLTDPC